MSKWFWSFIPSSFEILSYSDWEENESFNQMHWAHYEIRCYFPQVTYLLITTKEWCSLEKNILSVNLVFLLKVLFPSIQVTVLLVAHYLKFSVNVELQILSGTSALGVAVYVEHLSASCVLQMEPGMTETLRLNPEVCPFFGGAPFGTSIASFLRIITIFTSPGECKSKPP